MGALTSLTWHQLSRLFFDIRDIRERMATCDGCQLTMWDLVSATDDDQRAWDLCEDHGLVKSSTSCPTCGSLLQLKQTGFSCDRRRKIRGNKKVKVVTCRTRITKLKGTFFAKSNLSIPTILRLVYCFLLPGMTATEAALQCRVTRKTAIDWYSFFREVTLHYCDSTQEKLGGPGKVYLHVAMSFQ